jgi:hypothetical protein
MTMREVYFRCEAGSYGLCKDLLKCVRTACCLLALLIVPPLILLLVWLIPLG